MRGKVLRLDKQVPMLHEIALDRNATIAPAREPIDHSGRPTAPSSPTEARASSAINRTLSDASRLRLPNSSPTLSFDHALFVLLAWSGIGVARH